MKYVPDLYIKSYKMYSSIPQIVICCVFILIQFKVIFNFPFNFLFGSFRSVPFSFHLLGSFPIIFLLLSSFYIPLGSENILSTLSMIIFFKNYWDLFCSPVYGVSWRVFLVYLKRLFGMSYMCQWSRIGWQCCSSLLYPCWFIFQLFY